MTVAGFIEVLTAFFKFPDSVLALVKALKATPEAKHEQLVARIQAEVADAAAGGRPKW